MNTRVLIPLLAVLLIPTTEGFFFGLVNSIADSISDSVSNVLGGVNVVAHSVIHTIAPTDSYDEVDNTASRLLKTIANSSPGVLRESAKALNLSATPEIEASRQSVIHSLNTSNTTPHSLQNLKKLMLSFIRNVPRSTVGDSGLLSVIPEVLLALGQLIIPFTEKQLEPLIGCFEDIFINLAVNFRHMRTLQYLPKSLVRLHDQLASDRERILSVGQLMMQLNETQVNIISDLISSVDVITNAVPLILQSIQNVIASTRLHFENHSNQVVVHIQNLFREQLSYLPELINDATRSWVTLGEAVKKDTNEALEYNEHAIAESVALADRLNGVAGNLIDLLNRQIQFSLSAVHKSTVPTVSIIITQLNALLNATDAAINHSVTTSSNDLFATFDGVLSTLEMNLVKGVANPELCVNEAVSSVERISQLTVQSLASCASITVEDTTKFVNQILDKTDELLMDISGLADQLDVCSRGYNATAAGGNYSLFRLKSCLQSVHSNIEKSVALSHLSDVQVAITEKTNSVHGTVHTCVYQALYDADNSAVALEKTAENCFGRGGRN